MTELTPELTCHEVGGSYSARTEILVDAIRQHIGDAAVFAGDYTVVPIDNGVVVSKVGDPYLGRSQFADIRAEDGTVDGHMIFPHGLTLRDRLSTRTCNRYLLGAAQAVGIDIQFPDISSL